jgi:hypothetical protein
VDADIVFRVERRFERYTLGQCTYNHHA